MVNDTVTFFMVHGRRSREVFETLIQDWKGILISDGYKVYQRWVNLRQTCLSHLIRDARGLADRSKLTIRSFGEQALILLLYSMNRTCMHY